MATVFRSAACVAAWVMLWLACSVGASAKHPSKPFDKVRKTVMEAIKDSAFPSAVVAVMQNGRVLFHEAFGHLTYDTLSPRADTNTIYDLASVTKVLATTLSIMRLYDEGKLSLMDPVAKFIPEFATHGKEKILLRNLLIHDSGLIAFRRYSQFCPNADSALRHIFSDTLIKPVGDSTIYSDLNFILLGEIVRRITGKRLDAYFAETFAQPLGLRNTFFNPPDSVLYRVAPTEPDCTWKLPFKRPLVHDPNAALFGGVSGHAGLFSTASDILIVMRMIMNGGKQNEKVFIKPETVRLFTTRDTVHRIRALGWDVRTASENTSTGKYFSMQSYGHLGFTGTSVWVDPTRNLCVVFLTNRVYPTSANNKIRAVRRLLHDAVIESLDELAEKKTGKSRQKR
ncbi:MAG: serine hydrolase [Chloroherpetonaceae bacterium]|nr:serine hydrolase [Chloroherpetonaceae bacterium]